MNTLFALMVVLISSTSSASEKLDYKQIFGQRDGCFQLTDLATGKTVEEYQSKRCAERFSPCSTFKIAAAIMAFDSGVLKDDRQIVKWDGVKRDRDELNQDQTPYSWIRYSAIWVTQWITPQLGMEKIQNYLRKFSYGNQDFSGGLKLSWQTSSLKISAHEQTQFIKNLWSNQFPVSKQSVDWTKKIIFIKNLDENTEFYGKTGTGCLSGHDCDKPPGSPMIGWFTGVVKTKNKTYVVVANASDTETDPEDRAAGPRVRDTVIEILKKLGVTK